ncbi:MAG: SlyX family protein [Gammaproteobacteria bacterium]|nr:MAG: SlyX family protein [Gammaproteobacteria bacterium]
MITNHGRIARPVTRRHPLNELEETVSDLQARLAFLDDTVEQLSRAIYQQARELERQARTIRRLEDKLKAQAESMIRKPEDEPPPPHY